MNRHRSVFHVLVALGIPAALALSMQSASHSHRAARDVDAATRTEPILVSEVASEAVCATAPWRRGVRTSMTFNF